MPRTKLLIIGAGPTGLGAALRCGELDESDFLLWEAATAAGGLAASFTDAAGFTWDLGSHLQFSHYRKYDRFLDEVLPPEAWLEHCRSTWIWMGDRFVAYPFQHNLHQLPAAERQRCFAGLSEAQANSNGEPANFREWVLNTFGRGIADLFMFPYNAKLWTVSAEAMSHHWVGERVATPDVDDLQQRLKSRRDRTGWGPNHIFRYPQTGGTGAIWRSAAKRLPAERIRFGRRVVAVDVERRRVEAETGETCEYEFLLSTIPLNRLRELLVEPVRIPSTSGLVHTHTHIVGVGLDGQPPESLRNRCWIYFPQPQIPFYRVTLLSNLSPYNTPQPGDSWSLMAEVAEPSAHAANGRDVVQEVVSGMVQAELIGNTDRIRSRWKRSLSHGYPVPTCGRDSILKDVLSSLQAHQVYSRGRFGAWKYEVSNQDHSFMQGAEAVDHILLGTPEVTLHHPSLVNSKESPFAESADHHLRNEFP